MYVGPSDIPSSSPPAVTPLRYSAPFQTGRMNFLPEVYRRTLRLYIDDRYDCAEARQDVLDK